jgi:hypothetical protein
VFELQEKFLSGSPSEVITPEQQEGLMGDDDDAIQERDEDIDEARDVV